MTYWLVPVRMNDEWEVQTVPELLQKKRIWGFSDQASAFKLMRPGDQLCIYLSGSGVIGRATVESPPSRDPAIISPLFPWYIRLGKVTLFWETPIKVARLRSSLDAFAGKPLWRHWNWFVRSNRRLSEHDFSLLTTIPSRSKEEE